MAEFQAFDGHYLFTFKNKFDQWLKTKNSTASDSEEITRLLNEFILHLYKKKKLEPNWTPDSEVFVYITIFWVDNSVIGLPEQVILGISAQLLRCVNCQDSFKVAKVCQIWDHTLKLPNITVPGPTVDLFLEWYHKCLLHSNEVILLDIMNCLASAVVLKEVKQSKVIIQLLSFRAIQGCSSQFPFFMLLGIEFDYGFIRPSGSKDLSYHWSHRAQ